MHELDADDDYSSNADPEELSIGPAVFNDTVATLVPAEPILLRESAKVREAVQRMVQARQAAALVVDVDGRLAGIFTERDLLTRVVGRNLDPDDSPEGKLRGHCQRPSLAAAEIDERVLLAEGQLRKHSAHDARL